MSTNHLDNAPVYRTTRFDEGFTLLEVMIAVLVLAVAALAFFSSQWYAMRLDMASQQDEIAMTAARTQLERIKAEALGSSSEAAFAAFAAAQNNSTFAVQGLEPIEGAAEVGTITTNLLSPGLLEVTVTLEWRGTSGNENYSISGLISRF
jgi:prepilin-type N-terminal cleavage/methylation domain-containing protein